MMYFAKNQERRFCYKILWMYLMMPTKKTVQVNNMFWMFFLMQKIQQHSLQLKNLLKAVPEIK